MSGVYLGAQGVCLGRGRGVRDGLLRDWAKDRQPSSQTLYMCM